MIKTIIFDCYGTLISTGDGSIQATSEILKLNNCNIKAEVFYRHWKRRFIDICRSKPFMTEAEAFNISLKDLYQHYSIQGKPKSDVKIMLNTLGNRRAYPDVLGTLSKLKDRYKLVIGSNSDHDPLTKDLTNNHIKVHKVYSSEQLRVYKPDAEFFQKILDDLNVTPEEVIYVGDSLIDDIYGSSIIGIQSIWLNRKHEQLRDDIPEPLYEINNLEEITELLFDGDIEDVSNFS
jgi:haloacid dehalogenase superfamily, subfamily IA, variant 1 with third motif having Dx(3-4)D or Dx(3-4)E